MLFHKKAVQLLCVSALAFLPKTILAQSNTVSGFVSDSESGEKLIGAIVAVPSLGIGTATNTYGFYSLTIPTSEATTLEINYVGYLPTTVSVAAGLKEPVNIVLKPSLTLKEVNVSSSKNNPIHERSQMSAVEIPIAQAKSLPTFLGEVDILKTIQLLPGIQAGNEGSSSLIVRGGSPDQNLILLDGVPVYNAYHLFGFFSVFNADALSNMEVIKGGFPARYGGRLSSVIDIRMKEGNKQQIHAEGGIGLLASRLMIEGPILKNKMSFMVSGRRTYYDLLMRPFIKAASKGSSLVLNFYDLNGKLNYKISERDHVYVSAYMGNDKFGIKEKSDGDSYNAGIKWGNITGVARWNHLFNKKLFGNLTAYYSRYQFDLSSEYTGSSNDFKMRYFSGIHDWAGKYDFDYIPNNKHYIKMGAGGIYHTYTPGATQLKGTGITSVDSVSELHSFESSAYVEDDYLITDKLKINLGIHVNMFSVRSKNYFSFQPRISGRYIVFDRTSVKASYAKMNQYIHLLSNSGVGLPTDLWVPATDKILPMQADQVAAGIAHNTKNDIEISVEGFYKIMKNVLEYKNGASFVLSGSSWENKVVQGDGKAYGGEFFIHKKAGKTTGILSYTLSWSNRYFADLNEGKAFPYKYDRRHDFKVAAAHKISNTIELSAEWIFGTGNAMSIPTSKYYSSLESGDNGSYSYYYPSRNNYRMASYHRLDIGARFTKIKKRGTREWVLGVYNVYNRKNPFFIFTEEKNGATNFKQVSLLGIIPSISYNFKF